MNRELWSPENPGDDKCFKNSKPGKMKYRKMPSQETAKKYEVKYFTLYYSNG